MLRLHSKTRILCIIPLKLCCLITIMMIMVCFIIKLLNHWFVFENEWFVSVYSLTVLFNLLHTLIKLFHVLAHFIFYFSEIFLHHIIFIINKFFICINFLFKLIEFDLVHFTCHQFNLLIHYRFQIFMFILSKKMKSIKLIL